MVGDLSNNRISIYVYSLLIVGVVLVGLDLPILQLIGEASILLLLSMTFFLNLKEIASKKTLQFSLTRDEMKIFFPLVIWIFIYLIGLIKAHGVHDFYVVSQLILLISFTYFIIYKGKVLYPNRTFFNAIIVIIGANLIFVFYQSGGNFFHPFRPEGLFAHRNSLATTVFYFFILASLFYAKKDIRINILLIISCVYLIYVANSRAVYVTFLIFLFTYTFWKKISKNKIIYYGYLCLFIISNLLFVLLTIGFFAKVLPEATLLDLYFREYTGGNLHSGRHLIWPGIVEQIGENPLLGSGAGATPSDFLNTSLSSHNYYLQLLLQTGLLGASAFLCFIFYTWSLFKKARHDKLIRIIASFFISILFHQIFVVSLTQNNMEQAILFWFIVGLGLNRVKKIQHLLKNKTLIVD